MKNRILSLIMTAVTTASFMVSPCTHAFNIERECGEVVVTIIDEETNELFKEPGKFGMTMVDDKWEASESNPYTVKNVPKNDAYCITYDFGDAKYDDYYYAIDSEKSIPLFYLNADEDSKDITIYMHKRPIENKAEYGTIIVTVIDEETNELFKEDGVNDDVNFWIMGSSAEGQSSFGFGGSSHNQFNSNISNPYTLNNALVNESYKIIHLGYNQDGFTYIIDEEKSENDFVYSSTEPKEVKIYMKKDIGADHKVDTQVPEPDTSEYGTVTVTVIDKETNELFKEHSKFGLTVLDDKWDASESNPYTIKNVPKDNSYFITYDSDGEKYDGYYYRIDNYVLFKFDEGEDTKNVTVYMEKRPVEKSEEYGTITVTVIDEETNELFTEGREGGKSNFEMTRTYVTNSVPKEGKSDDSASDISGMSGLMGGQIYMGGWNSEQSNPYTFENAMAGNYMYHIIHIGIKHDGFTYMIDEEKSDNDFIYSSPEPKDVKIYMKKYIWENQKVDTDTLENPDIQADKEYTFEDIRNMTTDEIEALYKVKGIKDYHVYTAKSAFGSILLEPRPYLSDDVPDDVITEIHAITEVSKLLESHCRFDIEKVKKSLGLPAELFNISFGSMIPIGHEDNGEYIMKKYCECYIQPVADDQQEKAELWADAMNYIQLNPDYCGITPFASMYGGSDITAPVTTIKGDVNCDNEVDMADAVLIMQALANPNKYGLNGTADNHLTEQGKINGDMDGDGLTVGDAQAIQKKLLGLKDEDQV